LSSKIGLKTSLKRIFRFMRNTKDADRDEWESASACQSVVIACGPAQLMVICGRLADTNRR
jgi:hypothetical protein